MVSDGAGVLQAAGGPSPQSVAATADALHVPLFTLGLHDSASTPASMQRLAQVAGGHFAQATGGQLPHAFTRSRPA